MAWNAAEQKEEDPGKGCDACLIAEFIEQEMIPLEEETIDGNFPVIVGSSSGGTIDDPA